ncbi:B12 binding domain-containing protein [Streptomyces sp. Ag82_O1-12]|uniref:MerR family transcriptional regulator n=1 Tax=unclassified Streptomyces TaxID=2593676 RepID=UPI000BC7D7E0|nr:MULTISPECIES: MerR family transcriptional regulator [unclassified Streptomyces]SMQ18654.1 B12 binding domain-containing protein [Streptomyces sp. Ag82_O1-12]SOD47693.1 B12 binding domain-containing protein [Streptomyces sp. Ag82_G6-1]
MGTHERDGEDRGRGGVPPGGGLTTGEVARRLGVAPTTVRTWDRRYGLGPDAHTGGRHRRWTSTDVARLERMCALTATGIPPAEAARTVLGEATQEPAPSGWASPAPAEAAAEEAGEAAPGRRDADAPPRPSAPARSRAGSGLRLGDVRQECKGIARAALRLDAAALDELLEAAIAEHGLVAAWTEVIMPTLQAVGRKWESSGEKYVEVEHFLSWHVSGALRRGAPPSAADRPGATIVLACVPGENHTLPLEVLAAALAERGLPVRMFGGALPVESLVTAVRRTGPAAVGLWAQSRTTASRPLAQHVAAMEWGVRGARRKPVVLTIGPGWSGRTVTGLPRPTGLAEAVAVLESVVSR